MKEFQTAQDAIIIIAIIIIMVVVGWCVRNVNEAPALFPSVSPEHRAPGPWHEPIADISPSTWLGCNTSDH